MLRIWNNSPLLLLPLALIACGDDGIDGPAVGDNPVMAAPDRSDAQGPVGDDTEPPLTMANGAAERIIKSADDALPGVVIPPFQVCQDPLEGEPAGAGPDGQVCTHVSISGATEPGRHYEDYADCDVVLTQRPFWPREPDQLSSPGDPRLQDDTFMQELQWVTEQVEASACVCCHDSELIGGTAGAWDISLGPIWTDTIADSGVAMLAGLADSTAFGAFPPEDNNGFSRDVTGMPTTDRDRMRDFFVSELARRGLTEEEGAQVVPFGGPLYTALVQDPGECDPGVGVGMDGTVRWSGSTARYVYVMEEDADNPGVFPNLDLPDGTLWRLDVFADSPALDGGSGVLYGTTPPGTYQRFPDIDLAPQLEVGTTYRVVTLLDVGFTTTNCKFVYGG